jgi:hypothetical protein
LTNNKKEIDSSNILLDNIAWLCGCLFGCIFETMTEETKNDESINGISIAKNINNGFKHGVKIGKYI